MNQCYERTFDRVSIDELVKFSSFESCQFRQCDLQGADLSRMIFQDCTFEDCDLSLVKVNGTAFRGVIWKSCKLLGVRFDLVAPFLLAIQFNRCKLDHAVFTGLKLKKGNFRDSSLQGVDFSNADLTLTDLSGADLLNVTFEHTILEKADLRNATNINLEPERNSLSGARISRADLPGLLVRHRLSIS